MTPAEREAFKEAWHGVGKRLVQIAHDLKPIIDRLEAQKLEAQKADPTRKRYPTSGDALSTRKHRPRRTR